MIVMAVGTIYLKNVPFKILSSDWGLNGSIAMIEISDEVYKRYKLEKCRFVVPNHQIDNGKWMVFLGIDSTTRFNTKRPNTIECDALRKDPLVYFHDYKAVDILMEILREGVEQHTFGADGCLVARRVTSLG